MKVVGEIHNERVFEYWGVNVRSKVFLTEERVSHICQRHEKDYIEYGLYIPDVIEDPDVILEDSDKADTAMFVRHIDATNINVVVKIAYVRENSTRETSVITMYRLGEKTKKRLLKKNPIIYNRQEL